jgi:hypothetical protein
MTTLNPLEVYAEAGRRAAEAINQHDWPRSKFHSDWMRRAIRLESKRWAQMALDEFDAAYRAARVRVRR